MEAGWQNSERGGADAADWKVRPPAMGGEPPEESGLSSPLKETQPAFLVDSARNRLPAALHQENLSP